MPNSLQEQLTAKLHIQRGHRLWQKGRAREAIASYRHALGLEPNSAIASKTLARALKQQGKLAEAIIYYRQAIAINARARMRKQNTHSWELKPSNNQKMILTNSSNPNTNNIAARVYMSQANAYWQQKNLDETIAACEQALKNDPKLVEAYKLQGNVLQQQGKMLEAMGCYARALEINPEMPELYANLGSLYGKQQQWPEAISYYQKALQLNPHIPGFYQNLAKIYHKSGEKDKATQCLLQAQSLSSGPQDVKVPKKVIEVAATPPTTVQKPQQLNDLGSSHAQKQEWQQAIACYQKAISQDPNFAGAYRNMARALQQVGKRQEAVKCWHQALILEPTWGKGKDHLRLGNIFLKQGQIEKAIACYRRSLQVEPDFAAGYLQLGHLLSKQGNSSEAIACWRQGVANIPDNGSLHFHLGQALAQMEQWSEAIACYRHAIALEPERSEAHHNLGDMLQKEKQLQAAVASYRRAIELKPDFHWSHNNLGDALLQLEQWEAAATSYERSIELEPDFHWSHYNLAEALVKQKDWQGAIVAYRKAMELSSNLPYIHHKLANALKASIKSSSQEAVDLYLRAIEEEPDNLEIYHEALEVAPNNAQLYFSLGKALANQGDSEQAAAFQNLALQMQPDAWQEAVAAYSKMMESQPDSPLVNEKLSEAYTSVAQLFLQKALDNYRRAIQFTPDRVELYRLALTINPNDPELLFGLAKNLVRYDNNSSEVISLGGNETPMQLQGISPRALLHSVSPEPRVGEAKENFDWRFYVDCYPDLNHVSSYQEAYDHWLKLGKPEGRIASQEQFARVYGDKIPEDFNWQEYLEFNSDLKEAINSEWQATIHYAKSGHQEGRLYSRSQFYFQPQKKKKERGITEDFDWRFYLEYNSDLRHLQTPEQAYEHWLATGQSDGRISTEEQFYQQNGLTKADLPADFDWEKYLELNLDLPEKITCKWQAILHYLLSGIPEARIYSLQQLHGQPDAVPKSVPRKFNPAVSYSGGKKLAILVHIYYLNLWPELKSYIDHIEVEKVEYDLFINLVESVWKPEIHQQIRQDFPAAKILISKNRGKDIGGHLAMMAHLDFSGYDLFCLIHTKKSPHVSPHIADAWRKDLLDAILGSKEKVWENLQIMDQNPEIGLIGCRYWRNTKVFNNSQHYYRLLDEFQIKAEARECEYLSGTMMLVRPQIMKTIYHKFKDLELEDGDDRDLKFHMDGQIAHALERIIGNLVRHQGMTFFWQE